MMRRVTSGEAGGAELSAGDVEVSWADQGGRRSAAGLASVAGVAFEDAPPVREFASYRRQRHFPGLWWLAKTGRHVGYESWLERDHLMVLDSDCRVTGVSSQPFTLRWSEVSWGESSSIRGVCLRACSEAPRRRTQALTPPPPPPSWFGPRASTDDPAVAALLDQVAPAGTWQDIGGSFNLNVRLDAAAPLVLRVHRPWATRGRVAGLRRLRERLQRAGHGLPHPGERAQEGQPCRADHQTEVSTLSGEPRMSQPEYREQWACPRRRKRWTPPRRGGHAARN